ncbi:hypothetical protein [Psychrobacter piechaudii]|uniref:Uncharacterized protein n=1 Tax=Psychrobacter piechaudii TaxID=1945521 RepID=A0A1R4GV92_9GAMM|nr:hypothetical protein [Psychrobacter piechaudii]SJM71995.1 hypothetical protein A1232T_01478 [Psychrobacter piechaudii]
MNGISNFLPYLLISAILSITGCQSIAEHSNTSSDNINKMETIRAYNTPISEATAIVAIIKKYNADMVFITPKPHEPKIEVGACFYNKLSTDLKSSIESELSQTIGKNVVITPTANLTLPIGGLNESAYKDDPCFY